MAVNESLCLNALLETEKDTTPGISWPPVSTRARGWRVAVVALGSLMDILGGPIGKIRPIPIARPGLAGALYRQEPSLKIADTRRETV